MSASAQKDKRKKKATEAEDDAKSRSHRVDSDAMRSSVSSSVSDASSADLSSPSRRQQRPRFDSKASWADSTRFDMGRADSRASDMSARDLRLTGLGGRVSSSGHNRSRADSRASRLSRSSSRSSMSVVRGRQSSFVSNFGVTKGKKRKDSNALSTITENWNLADDQFGSPFSEFDAQEQPVREELQRGLAIINDHTTKLKEIEDAITAAMSEVWGYWADPIQLYLHPAERVDVQDLIKTDNELFNKVLTVFSVLCDEISELKVTVEDNFYPALIMFGQARHGQEDDVKAGEDEVHIGRMLAFFQDISNFVDRCNAITINMIHQLASLYQSFQKLWKSTFKLVHLHPVFDALASLLEVMITIDAIVIDNPNIITSWDKYKRMMQYVRSDPPRYNVTVDKVKQFERLLVSLDQTIMSAQVFQSCIEQDFEVFSGGDVAEDDEDPDGSDSERGGRRASSSGGESRIDIRTNRVFLEEFVHCISARLSIAEGAITSATETFERNELVGTAGLYVLLRRLQPSNVPADPVLFKRLWETQLKAPCVTICGKIMWYMPDFLLKFAPMTSKKLHPTDVVQFRREYLHSLDDAFPADVTTAKLELSAWLVRMESFFQPTTRGMGDASRTLSIRGNLILKGLILAKRVQTMMHTLVNLHLSLQIPMPKRVVRPLYTCIEILKAVEFMFARKNPVLAESSSHLLRQVAHSLFSFFRPLKAHLEASKKFDDTKLDVLAAVTVLEDILNSGESFSYTRITVLDLAAQIAMISPDNGNAASEKGGDMDTTVPMGLKDAGEPVKLIWKLRLLSDFQRKIRSACDCSFFYWSRELLHPFMSDLYTQPEQANRIQYVVGGFLDAIKLLRGAQHETDNELYVKAYAEFIESVLEEEIVESLCKDVENDLRLHVHSVHLDHLDAPNPKNADFKVLHYYLDLRPIRLHGKTLDLRQQVTHYLESTFYNLTTVALHDWKTYGEMRNLANDKYGLSLADNHLPMGSLDQGLDILQIMRNIQIFVARYNYNLNQQFFLERRSDKGSRHLNSINIHSIASSIRTHGMGIMNTTVNFTYQFLTKKFDIFSQFLFDEYIKSYLQREKRWYKKHRDDKEVENKYPFDRAFQFNKDIRKLGVSDSGKTFLDQFRMLITEIGNALGYVRMVRSAGMNYCSNAIKFVPDLNHTHFKFEAYAGDGVAEEKNDETGEVVRDEIVGAKLSRETVVAARNLDSVISTLAKNFSENNDYFKVLVKVFQDVTASDEQKHLVNFYTIIPALTINYVETTVQAKDLMYKNTRRRESYFSDDGFAIGVAYILAILDQGEQFDALHWFEEVARKYKVEEEAYNEKQAEREARKREQAAKKQKETTAELIDDEEEVHTLQLTAKRIELNRREFDLLDWSLNGARIFFKD
ncbi:WASH complex subunit 4 [Phytophthora fragariae]|uniref:WASH complex subunit 4 n=1 Tax=Phytophthora fragariae TaxID=53985 RepID=A0A6A3X688_9STRA|nr:WASH complex subunit 4 [Phytophthora fragariae]KAE8941012.1 WASH complex subunit 4 [Phytophthora fragariae]KAE9093187.1 WASH complex subunit 4 [Phytophthora fragariae]KAE9094406.1 WASH complex subunit 4 [Phytophthora fragariae]KAE9121401.1 WASH complex subunit 4 [Phytophthora fragariae]